ncbi:ABC transporter substrate-binding protein [Kineococcus rhizosphaerae]|uniref:ABC-type nitrate/sulfonate/bicarbonate transport system substrate-binding protein n=1 Tax=Kineococcus rhizosphaerae TaxID=559628 RepID=A0A2T0R7X0_9ACTN|nr:ABC transporter substrate-binding protein [Kineococcus rhizosphaerae]PRY17224.1 ABC-type nitrate/sulfonate/bicarbonate transport system substrate-binding protein [Kineococcus rhizosphaerae]
MDISRRRLNSLAAVGALAALGLSACGGDDSSASSGSGGSGGSGDFGDIGVQLSYIKNIEFAGNYLAVDDGHYTDAGFGTVTLTAGGSSATNAEAQVASGKSFIGISSPLITAPAVVAGAEIKIIAADYQKNPFDIVSLKSAPLSTPADLKGKTVAVSDFNSLVFQAFMAANRLSKTDVTIVPYTDGEAQLASGQVQGYLGYTTDFSGVAGNDDQATTEFLLADNGLPMVGEVVLAAQSTIDDDRDKLKAYLVATIKGWKDALADPELAVKTTVEDYGKDQDLDSANQLSAFTKQTTLMVTEDTKAHGLFTITPDLVDDTVAGLQLADIDITAEQLFDTTVIAEVYQENPDLV